MRYLEDFKSQEFVRTIGGLELVGMTWDDAIAELRVTLDDRSSPMPLHAQVAARLEELIETGGLPVGARIQSEVTLAERLGISRPTMRRAMQHLVDKGLVVRKPGAGTEVVMPSVRRPVELTSLYDDLVRAGRNPSTDVLSFAVIPASDAVALALHIPPRTEVTSIDRLRYADGQPLALMHNLVPAHFARFAKAELQRRGLYELLRAAAAVPKAADEVIGARSATAEEAEALGIKRGAPVLTMTRTAWNTDGRGIEHGSHVYRADRYAFQHTVRAEDGNPAGAPWHLTESPHSRL
jgi:DNA-binding GntR family transcriptional regulator